MKNIFFVLLLGVLLFNSCKKTIDSETARWDSNQARLERLQSEYPNFKTALQAQLLEAKSVYEEALTKTDDETRLLWLNKANKAATPSYVNTLDNMDRKIEELRENAVKLFEYAENNKGLLVAGLKQMNVESTITEAKGYMSSVSATNKNVADQVVRKALGKIDRLNRSIEDNIRKIERAQRELEAEKAPAEEI